MDDVMLLCKLIAEHATNLRRDDLDGSVTFSAVIDDSDAEKLAARVLTDRRFNALRRAPYDTAMTQRSWSR